MPGTLPQGTHTFDPGSLSCTSATQALIEVNAEDDGEDQLGPPINTPVANMPEAFTSAVSSLLPTASSAGTSLSNVTSPPSSSSISLTTLHDLTYNPLPLAQKHHVSVDSAHSITTNSDTSSSQPTSMENVSMM